MTAWTNFRESVVGKTLRITRRDHDWHFDFEGGLILVVEGVWRMRDPHQLVLTSCDDGHQFGLASPFDAQGRANDVVGDSVVNSIDCDPATADLKVHLSNGLVVEVLTMSAGYENWQAYSEATLAGVGRNGGVVGIASD